MKVLADSLNGQEGVPVELYQEFMQDITSEIDRENQIITDLLSLVKMDKKVADLNITQVNINELLEQLLKRLHPIAAQKNVELILDSFRPVNAEVDATKLSLAFSNLIENGIKYNNENGWVRVSLKTPASASRRSRLRISSSVSTAWTSPTRGKSAEPALALRLRGARLSCTGERSVYTAKKTRERHFPCGFL